MKKYITVLFLFSITCHSQSLEIGINAGVVGSRPKAQEPSYNKKYLYGILLEGNIGYFFNPYIGVGTGLMYDQRGYSEGFYGEDGFYQENDIHYNYISIPAKITFCYGKSLFISASVGANFSMLFSKTIYIKTTGAFDFSGFAEMRAGYELKNGFALFCQGKFQPSFCTSFASGILHGDYKHRVAVLSIGAKFRIPNKAEPIN